MTQQCVTAAGVLAENGVQQLEVVDTVSGRLIRQLLARLTDLPGELLRLEVGEEVRFEGGRLWRAAGTDHRFVLWFSGVSQWEQRLCTQGNSADFARR